MHCRGEDLSLRCRLDRQHPLAQGLVGWWKAVPDARGPQWYDLSGLGHPGTLTNMNPASDWIATARGLALDLDGVDDYVAIGDQDCMSFTQGTTDRPFSVCAWVRMRDATFFRAVGKLYDSALEGAEWIFTGTGGDLLGLVLYSNTTASRCGRTGTIALTPWENSWIWIGGTYNGSGSDLGILLYLNGVLVESTSVSTADYAGMRNTTAPVRIGTGAGNYANGQIDDVRIYSRCLSSAEMAWVYADSLRRRYAMVGRPRARRRVWSEPQELPTAHRLPWHLFFPRAV